MADVALRTALHHIDAGFGRHIEAPITTNFREGLTVQYHMPSHAHLMVQDGEMVSACDVLAKIPPDLFGGLVTLVSW